MYSYLILLVQRCHDLRADLGLFTQVFLRLLHRIKETLNLTTNAVALNLSNTRSADNKNIKFNNDFST